MFFRKNKIKLDIGSKSEKENIMKLIVSRVNRRRGFCFCGNLLMTIHTKDNRFFKVCGKTRRAVNHCYLPHQ